MKGNLNLFVASCAVLISAASFIATYIQADAAKKQTKALTTPLIRFTHENYNSATKEQEVYFDIENAGTGAAVIYDSSFIYKGERYKNVQSYFQACCINNPEKLSTPLLFKKINGSLIKGQSKLRIMSFKRAAKTQAIWKRLNKSRDHLNLEICYCSLLEECYVTHKDYPLGKPIEQCT